MANAPWRQPFPDKLLVLRGQNVFKAAIIPAQGSRGHRCQDEIGWRVNTVGRFNDDRNLLDSH